MIFKRSHNLTNIITRLWMRAVEGMEITQFWNNKRPFSGDIYLQLLDSAMYMYNLNVNIHRFITVVDYP